MISPWGPIVYCPYKVQNHDPISSESVFTVPHITVTLIQENGVASYAFPGKPKLERGNLYLLATLAESDILHKYTWQYNVGILTQYCYNWLAR